MAKHDGVSLHFGGEVKEYFKENYQETRRIYLMASSVTRSKYHNVNLKIWYQLAQSVTVSVQKSDPGSKTVIDTWPFQKYNSAVPV